MSKKKKKFGKPLPLLYYPAVWIVSLIYRIKYGLSVDRSGLKGLKGPALILSPHISGKDHILHAVALYPHRPTFVMSEHFLSHPLLRKVLKYMHVITKKMFTADVSTILNIMRAKASGNIIVLFPEGRLTWYGHSGPIASGTADLVKKMSVPVYAVISNGSYLTFPKWGLPRKGKIRVTTKQLFTEDQLKSMDVSEIRDRLAEELLHDEEQAMAGVPYRCKDTTEGLSKILYTCPSCLSEDTIVSGENRVRCVKCGMTAQLDETYRLTGCRFRSINEWVDWQSSRIDTESFRIDTPVILDAVNEKGNMVHEAGQGRLVYDRNVFELHGTLFGVPLDFSVKSEKIPAFPVTPGHHFDIYDRGHLLNIVPQNPSDVIRIASFCDRLREENEKAVRGETVS